MFEFIKKKKMCVKPLVGTQLLLSSFIIRWGGYQNTHKDFIKKWKKKLHEKEGL